MYQLKGISIRLFREIIHLPRDEYMQAERIYDVNRPYGGHTHIYGGHYTTGVTSGFGGYGTTTVGYNSASKLNIPGYTELGSTNKLGPVPRSNFVTSDGYVPSYLNPNPISNLPPSYVPRSNFNQTNLGGTAINQSQNTPSFMNNPQFAQNIASAIRNSTTSNNNNFNQQPPEPSFMQNRNLL